MPKRKETHTEYTILPDEVAYSSKISRKQPNVSTEYSIVGTLGNKLINKINSLENKHIGELTDEAGRTLLMKFASSPDHTKYFKSTLKKLQNLINSELNLNLSCQDIFGNTALHHASIEVNNTMLKVLLEFGADISIKNNKGETPLHILARTLNILGIEEVMVSFGIMKRDLNKHTSLFYAYMGNNIKNDVMNLLEANKLIDQYLGSTKDMAGKTWLDYLSDELQKFEDSSDPESDNDTVDIDYKSEEEHSSDQESDKETADKDSSSKNDDNIFPVSTEIIISPTTSTDSDSSAFRTPYDNYSPLEVTGTSPDL